MYFIICLRVLAFKNIELKLRFYAVAPPTTDGVSVVMLCCFCRFILDVRYINKKHWQTLATLVTGIYLHFAF